MLFKNREQIVANLKSIAQLAFNQLNPGGGDETSLDVEEYVETAKSEYAWQMQLWYWAERQREGEAVMPSHLLKEVEMDVVDDAIDISSLSIFRNFSSDLWLQNIGGLSCTCRYQKSDLNLTQLLCGDDSQDENVKTYYVVGKKIKFPQGTHAKKLTIIYANRGEDVDDEIEIDDGVAGIVRSRLIEIYGGKVPAEDTTNNSNPNS